MTKLIVAFFLRFSERAKTQFESCHLWTENMQTSHTKQSTHPLARQHPGCRRSRWHSSLAPSSEYQMTLQGTCPLCHQLHTLACPPAPLLQPSEAPCNKHITCHFILLIHSGSSLITKCISSQNNNSQQKTQLCCFEAMRLIYQLPFWDLPKVVFFFPFQKRYVDKTKVDKLFEILFGFGKTVI